MISGTLTLFHWSLRADTRSAAPHIVRAGFCVFMLFSILLAWGESLGRTAPGLAFFSYICFMNVVLISVSGISYFVSAVTEEKDSGTLALLRLAGVSPLAIILSKSTSRLISALMLLLIQLPFTFLAITLGGVTWLQIIAAYLSLAAWMCMVANIALFSSVRCETSGRAAALATTALLLFFAAGPILSGFASLRGVPWISADARDICMRLFDQQQALSVTVSLFHLLGGQPNEISLLAPQIWGNILIGLFMFTLSVLMFNLYTQPAERVEHGRSVRVRRFTVGRCWKWAIVWKDFLFLSGGKSFFITKLAGYALLIGGFAWFHRLEYPGTTEWISKDLTWYAFGTVGVIFTVEILLFSAVSLFQELRQGSLGLLRMLPTETPVLLLQKAGAAILAMAPAMLAMLFLLLYRPDAMLADRNFPQMVVTWVFAVLVASHLSALLSLYVSWGALPLALFLTVASSWCLLISAAGLTQLATATASANGIRWGAWFGVGVNFIWLWLFILLPIQLEICRRWNRLSQDS